MSIETNRWLHDFTILSNLRTSLNDKLELANDRLHLVEGNHNRKRGRTVTANPAEIADYLESLTLIGKKHFESLKSEREDSPSFYEKMVDFKKQVKCLQTRISDLQYTFRSHDCNNKEYATRYSELFELAHTLFQTVKEYKATLIKPPVEKRPIKHIEYNERTELSAIKSFYPKRIPIEDTVKAAKKALSLSQSNPQSLGGKTVLTISMIPAGFLTILKIILWNPFEWLFRGEVRTISPLRWVLQELRTNNRHMYAYQSFSTQILQQPFITEKVTEAFKELAPEADLLYLKYAVLATEDITELAPFIEEDKRPGAISVSKYLFTMKELCKKKNIKLQTLQTITIWYKIHNNTFLNPNQEKNPGQSVEDFLDKALSKYGKDKDADAEFAHKSSPYITPIALKELLKAAASSPTCREITLSSSLFELEYVRDFLRSHSYKIKEDHGITRSYFRYSLI